jgi:hypothetical protein
MNEQTGHDYLTITEQNRVNKCEFAASLAKGKAEGKMSATIHKEG